MKESDGNYFVTGKGMKRAQKDNYLTEPSSGTHKKYMTSEHFSNYENIFIKRQ